MYDGEEGREGGGRREEGEGGRERREGKEGGRKEEGKEGKEGGNGGKCSVLNNFYFFLTNQRAAFKP